MGCLRPPANGRCSLGLSGKIVKDGNNPLWRHLINRAKTKSATSQGCPVEVPVRSLKQRSRRLSVAKKAVREEWCTRSGEFENRPATIRTPKLRRSIKIPVRRLYERCYNQRTIRPIKLVNRGKGSRRQTVLIHR